ncbi:hypothetical protein [Stigmatella aurantiaca]|uniref:Conserved uncharacterized protein n=1 Tax=Stigmatella aurantiaca (strain DW4/3-1) TaxID=378806 RepID=Q08UX7_STIAD|nr:hypothetical protein [Stigmatella aurantiaca]ADO68822.1 conserved uncharacterized protein [Stigmatella aurantiaca DW4/3-1]EAU64299.1 hypothetical protein STIAU_0721 [Stigmatella aurantiaca DW4/3-1]
MSKLVWSIGGGGALLAGALTLWLQRPVELPAEDLFPTALLQINPATPPASPVRPHRAKALPPAPAVPAVSPSPSPSRAQAPVTVARRPPPVREEGTLATQLRGRIAVALRGDHPTLVARRDAVLSEFFASGKSQEPWTQEARTALERWRETITTSVLPVQWESTECYSAGCLAQVKFPDTASYEEAHRRVAGLQLGEVGPHMQLPPEHLPSGEVTVSWAVLRPEPL